MARSALAKVGRGGGGAVASAVGMETLRALHGRMVLVRTAEERLMARLRSGGRWTGTLHPSRGQEAVSVATVAHLTDEDWASPTPRELGVHLCRGMPLAEVFAHFAGAVNGGALGSVVSRTTPSLGSTASNLAVGAGIAMAFKLRRQPRVAMGFFGDGVMGTGTAHEVFNLSAAHGLPYVLVCNNNGMAFSQPVAETSPVVELGSRGEAYGLPWKSVDGTDVEAVWLAAREAVQRARDGGGATLLECRTPRLGGFTTAELMEETIPRDAVDVLPRLEARLVELGVARTELEAAAARARQQVDEAVAHTEALPVVHSAALRRRVYAD
ncbi:MAG: thiamine pyrophosphate-dependent dehydrogenase E1 component subunit alpha [Deltaproteobacteria bacterium]|nr:thiamine pyrophosphate-dependent dehydrogenase E1 component subunit alpha [Deltaproteobacteria bacterium]